MTLYFYEPELKSERQWDGIGAELAHLVQSIENRLFYHPKKIVIPSSKDFQPRGVLHKNAGRKLGAMKYIFGEHVKYTERDQSIDWARQMWTHSLEVDIFENVLNELMAKTSGVSTHTSDGSINSFVWNRAMSETQRMVPNLYTCQADIEVTQNTVLVLMNRLQLAWSKQMSVMNNKALWNGAVIKGLRADPFSFVTSGRFFR